MSESVWKQRAESLIKERQTERKKLEYTLKLQVEQEAQEINQLKARLAKEVDKCTSEYEQFKSQHPAHSIVQDIHELQGQVHRLDATKHALFLHIKFGELRYPPIYFCRLLFEGEMECGNYISALEAFLNIHSLLLITEKLPKLSKSIKEFMERARKEQLDSLFPEQLRKAQEAAGWPNQLDLSEEKQQQNIAFMEAFQKMLTYEHTFSPSEGVETTMGILMEPIRIRFHYHFSTDRPTNRLDKPEWFLEHLRALAVQEGDFVHRFLQPENISIDIHTLYLQELGKLAREKLFNNLSLILGLQSEEERRVLLNGTIEVAIEYLEEEDVGEFVEMAREAFDAWVHSVHAQAMTAYEEALTAAEAGDFISDIKDELERWLALIVKLSLLPSMQYRVFEKTVIALMTRVLNKLEYECPLSNMSSSEAEHCQSMLTDVQDLKDYVTGWGEDLGLLELAASVEFRKNAGYDATKLPGTVFHKTIQALVALQDKINGRLENYVMDGFSTGATLWANAMFYVEEEVSHGDEMHDGLRRALVELEPRIKLIQSNSIVLANVLVRINDFILNKLILRNYFSHSGALKFQRDLRLLTQVLGDTRPVQMALQPTSDAAVLLANENNQRLVRLLEDEDVEEATRLLQEMNIESLPLETCEQVLASAKK